MTERHARPGSEAGSATALAEGPKRVLVADASDFFPVVVEQVLTASGYEVEILDDLAQVEGRLRIGGFDLLVLDRHLPEMKQLELLRDLRESFPDSELPILVATERLLDPDEATALREAGGQGCVNKFAPADHLLFHANAVVFPVSDTERSARRVPFCVPVRVLRGATTTFAYSYCLSRGGVYVRASDPPREGSDVTISFTLPDGSRTLRVAAVVVHSHDPGEARHVPPGFGVRFVDPSPEDIAAIDRHVDRFLERD